MLPHCTGPQKSSPVLAEPLSQESRGIFLSEEDGGLGKGWTACAQGVLAGCYYLLFISKVPQQCKSLNPQDRYLPSQETPTERAVSIVSPGASGKFPVITEKHVSCMV